MKKTLHVDIERDESGMWVGVVREDIGILTQGRSLALVNERIREAMQASDIDPDAVEIISEVKLPATAKKAIKNAKASRQKAETETQRSSTMMAEAIQALTKLGVSIRDAAEMLGVSSARVHQILHGR